MINTDKILECAETPSLPGKDELIVSTYHEGFTTGAQWASAIIRNTLKVLLFASVGGTGTSVELEDVKALLEEPSVEAGGKNPK